jgi:hypothetical protein
MADVSAQHFSAIVDEAVGKKVCVVREMQRILHWLLADARDFEKTTHFSETIDPCK